MARLRQALERAQRHGYNRGRASMAADIRERLGMRRASLVVDTLSGPAILVDDLFDLVDELVRTAGVER